MTDLDGLNRKIEKVAAMLPEERDRLDACARVVMERGNELLTTAFEKQLDQMIMTRQPEVARKQLDKVEHTLMRSALWSPFLGAREGSGAKRALIVGAVVAVFVGMLVLLAVVRGVGAT